MGRSGSSGGSRSGGGFRSSGGGSRSSGGRRSGGASRGGFSSGSSRSSFGSRSSGGSSWSGAGRAGRSGSSSSGFGGTSRPTIRKPSGRTGGASSPPPPGGFGSSTRWSAPRPPSSNHSYGFGGLGGGIRGVGGGIGGAGGGSRPAGSPSPDRGARGCGCLSVPVVVIAIILLVFLFGFARCGVGNQLYHQTNNTSSNSGSSTSITVSTIRRTKLESGIARETGYYNDELGWIGNASTLTAGMKNFYKRTGVWPYLYITDTVEGTHYPTDAQLDSYANNLYEELFEDEGHLLVLFFEYDSEYAVWYVTGNAAATVIDSEAADILLDYIDRYYYSELSDEAMFSKSFDEASQRMMHITVSPWVYVLGVFLVLVILGVAIFWWAMAKKKKKEEEERLEQILHTPLETYEDADLKQREGKYTGDTSQTQAPSAANRQDEIQ